MEPMNSQSFTDLALAFVRALGARDYAAAYEMTSASFRGQTNPMEMQATFEEMVPLDWGEVEPIEVVQTMDQWPGKQPGDAGWVYVSIYGDVYSEGVTVVVATEEEALKIREVEWGRP